MEGVLRNLVLSVTIISMSSWEFHANFILSLATST